MYSSARVSAQNQAAFESTTSGNASCNRTHFCILVAGGFNPVKLVNISYVDLVQLAIDAQKLKSLLRKTIGHVLTRSYQQ